MAVVQQRPVVQVPDQTGDRPVWARVGIIAVIGFIVGIAWPRLAGVRLGPVPPDEGKPSTAVAPSGSAARAPALAATSSVQTSASAPASASPAAGPGSGVIVSQGKVLSCRNAKGKSLDDCDNPDFETVSGPRLKALSKCPATPGLNGKLSIGFDLDFSHNRIKLVKGKSTTVSAAASTGIFQCLETEFQKAKLDEVTHQHARYTIFYTVQFAPGGKAAEVEPATDKERSEPGDQEETKPKEAGIGPGQVVYDTVLVRDEPKEGKVIARLVRGTRVELLSRKGGWYKIRFGDREGWVYRGSVAQ